MLAKMHMKGIEEDFGLVTPCGKYLQTFEAGTLELTATVRQSLSPVVRVNALWMEKDVYVKCDVASTLAEKKVGLQAYPHLEADEGLYFPYPGGASVTFHQGTVAYPLDLLFTHNGMVVKMEQNTKVGSKDRWSCSCCDGVIEVVGGFCKNNGVRAGDRLALFANSEQDVSDYSREQTFENIINSFFS